MRDGYFSRAILAVLASAAACGGESRGATHPPQPPLTSSSERSVDAGAPTDAPVPVRDAAPPPLPGPSGPAAVPLDPTAAAAATQLLAPLGAQQAPEGAKPIGGLIAGQFQAGQVLERDVQMQPGRCYTVVGVGLPPVEDLDLQLVTGVSGLPGPIIAEDKTDASNAVLGGKPNCFKWALPVAAPVKVVVTVAAGQGVAAAQVYEK